MVTRTAPYSTRTRFVAAARPSIPMDAVRSDEAVDLFFDLPGFDPSSVELTVDRNVLSLSATRRWETGADATVLVAERRQGDAHRQLRLSDSLDGSKVAASFDNGVLHVRIPVAESAQPHKVDIELGGLPSLDAITEATSEEAPSAN